MTLLRIALFLAFVKAALFITINDPQNDFIKWGEPDESGAEHLSMNENNHVDLDFNISAVRLKEYEIDTINDIKLDFLPTNTKDIFAPVLHDNGDQTIDIQIGKKIDYEDKTFDAKYFHVTVTDKSGSAQFELAIKNIDDEPPTFVNSKPCFMQENTTIDLTVKNCSYRVQDTDGFLAGMHFDFAEKDVSNTFVFKYDSPPPADTIYDAEVYLVLQDGVQLDHEQAASYLLTLQAKDSGGNPTDPIADIPIMVQVIDIVNQPPQWVVFSSSETFNEKTEQHFTVKARDGDTGLNNEINYKITDEHAFTSINAETGEITVKPISRDEGYPKIVASVTAFKKDYPDWNITGDVTYIIVDVDDNPAIITIDGSDDKKLDLSINENSNTPLDKLIICNDVDEGENALYTVSLEKDDEATVDYSVAFQIAPGTGYQKQTYTILVADATLLDYENEDWRTITFYITTTGTKTNTNIDRLPVTITLIDVDDTDPTLQISTTSITLDENQKDGTKLPIEIVALDPDTKAELTFTIDWDQSIFTKNGAQIKTDDSDKYKECIHVETIKGETNNKATAELSIVETLKDKTPDYEKFDSLKLYFKVLDTKTEQGLGSAFSYIEIIVGNIHDNPPQFTDECKKQNLTVNENAEAELLVGSCTAVNIDNMGDLVYSMEPKDTTTAEWVKINPENGEIKVNATDVIDCDSPLRWYINYTISVYDGGLTSKQDIAIYVIDINDNKPILNINDSQPLYTLEDQTSATLYTLEGTDIDRSEPYRTIEYHLYVSDPEITNRFAIDGSNLVVETLNGYTLDRDYGTKQFTSIITYNDNPSNLGGFRNIDTASFTVILLDVNNQTPEITIEKITTNENLKKDEDIVEQIEAKDDDEEGPNSEIDFEILKIEKVNDTETELPDKLFSISTDEKHSTKKAVIKANYDLKGLYGTYKLTIKTSDFGDPQQVKEDNTVQVEVQKFNFNPPEFIFPSKSGDTYYIKTQQNHDASLIMYNGVQMDNIKAKDVDNKFDIKFSLEHEFFQISNADSLGQSTGQLQLKATSLDMGQKYSLTITADISSPQIDGEESHTVDTVMTIGFFDLDSDPVFPDDFTQMTGSFYEQKYGSDQSVQLERSAYYPDVDIEGLEKYYLLHEGNATAFKVDSGDGKITLTAPLVYNEITSYDLVIRTSHRIDPSNEPAKNSLLQVHIDVIEVNAHEPVFAEKEYYGVILPSYIVGITTVATVNAVDEDKGDKLTYSIVKDSLTKNGTGIDDINDPFTIDSEKGDIILNFQASTNMKGSLSFTVMAKDSLFPDSPEPDLQHSTSTEVKIFFVTESDRVNFKFQNNETKVIAEKDNIIKVLSSAFGYICKIEMIYADKVDGKAMDNQTISTTYFINGETNGPMPYNDIIKKITDVAQYTNLKQDFMTYGLILLPFDSDSTTPSNNEELLKAWLIGVSVVLGTLCLIFLIAFSLRIRSLNQRISNLTTPKFGSQDSGLNRIGINAPTTNKHAIEGSNPVFNNDIEKKDFDHVIDNVSIASGDSGLIGVEDSPQFSYDS